MQHEVESYWQDWVEGTRDVPGLRLHTISLFMRMRDAAQDKDWERFQRLFDAYSYVDEFCQDEPLLTVYENGLMYINTELADSMWVRGDLPRAIDHIEWVADTLEAGDARRAESGMVPRPNSELRFQCIGIRSACCLEDPAFFKTGSPELETSLLASEFWRLAEATTNYLAEKDDLESDTAKVILHSLARWELEVCKLCERYNPAFLALAIDFFNARMGPHLEPEFKHFLTLSDNDSRSGWYWDFEISKLETRKEYTRADVLLCFQQRSTSARLSFGKGPTAAFQEPWQRQLDRMLKEATQLN